MRPTGWTIVWEVQQVQQEKKLLVDALKKGQTFAVTMRIKARLGEIEEFDNFEKEKRKKRESRIAKRRAQ